MLEMKNFRENPEEILKDLKRRKLSDEVFKNVIKQDNRWRELIEEGNQIRAKRNSISNKISVFTFGNQTNTGCATSFYLI